MSKQSDIIKRVEEICAEFDSHSAEVGVAIARLSLAKALAEAENRAAKAAEFAPTSTNTGMAAEAAQICAYYERQFACALIKGETCGNFGACRMQRKLRHA